MKKTKPTYYVMDTLLSTSQKPNKVGARHEHSFPMFLLSGEEAEFPIELPAFRPHTHLFSPLCGRRDSSAGESIRSVLLPP